MGDSRRLIFLAEHRCERRGFGGVEPAGIHRHEQRRVLRAYREVAKVGDVELIEPLHDLLGFNSGKFQHRSAIIGVASDPADDPLASGRAVHPTDHPGFFLRVAQSLPPQPIPQLAPEATCRHQEKEQKSVHR